MFQGIVILLTSVPRDPLLIHLVEVTFQRIRHDSSTSSSVPPSSMISFVVDLLRRRILRRRILRRRSPSSSISFVVDLLRRRPPSFIFDLLLSSSTSFFRHRPPFFVVLSIHQFRCNLSYHHKQFSFYLMFKHIHRGKNRFPIYFKITTEPNKGQ